MNRILFILAVLIFCAGIGLSNAELYKWVDKEGNVHYSDSPASGRNSEKIHAL